MKPYGEDEGKSASPAHNLRKSAPIGLGRKIEIYGRPDVRERRKRLAEVIDAEILPRLRSIHHSVGSRPASVPCTPEEIEEFGALAIGAEPTAVTVYFERLRARGHSIESLFESLLAPTARHLGELWSQDRCDFVDVTLGVARLQELLETFGNILEVPYSDAHHRALLISPSNERHHLGVDMVAKFMRGAGWDVDVEKGREPLENAATAADLWYGVVGVTLGNESGLDTVAHIIECVRRESLNPAIAVMVGGKAFTGRSDLVARVGADSAAEDGPTAVLLAKKLVMENARGA